MIKAKSFVSCVPCTKKKFKLHKLFAVSWKKEKQLAKTLIINQLNTNKGIAGGASLFRSGLKDKNTKISNMNRSIYIKQLEIGKQVI